MRDELWLNCFTVLHYVNLAAFHNMSRILFHQHLYLGVPSLASHLDNIGPMTAHTQTRPANHRHPAKLHVISAPLAAAPHRVLFVCLRTSNENAGSTGSVQTGRGISHDFPLMRTPVTAEDARSRTEREQQQRLGSGVRCCWMRESD